MQQVTSPNVDKLPDVGYWVSNKERKEKFYKTESHIHKQGALSGAKATAHKLTNDIFTYFPKGFSGSKNSDFYEFLSLGMVPYIAGSATLIGLYGITKGKMNLGDGNFASRAFKGMTSGVILYAIGKWLSPKISHKLIKKSTGIDLDMLYINKVNELPENGQEKGLVRTQYPGVFASTDFYRKDLIEKDGEINHNNIYHYYDELAKKAGYTEKLNAPNQTMGKKIREVKSKATALESISKYIMAAMGVALGSQKSLSQMEIAKVFEDGIYQKGAIKSNIRTSILAAKKSLGEMWQGSNRNVFTKHGGKALILASVFSTLLSFIIPSLAFKSKPDSMKSHIDETKEFEVC